MKTIQFTFPISEQRRKLEEAMDAMHENAKKNNLVSFTFMSKQLARILDNYYGGCKGTHTEIFDYSFRLVFNSKIQPDGRMYVVSIKYESYVDELFIASNRVSLYGGFTPSYLPVSLINQLQNAVKK